ncbi:hypothetical protein ACFPMF_06060 [Larkinella bovis]|uniref:2Fe-2S ferredoxin-type domain-containing protein n=1 Tax=Larkinella bovis TaxID=683041 RepID=A0ABW0I5Q3_9BACT
MGEPEIDTISFTLVYQGDEIPVQTYRNQYISLMSLISDTLQIPDFGLCCGMGSCGTCVVEIGGMRGLACEISVDASLANTRILIP